MKTFRTRREISRARASVAAPPSSVSLEMVIATSGGRLDISFNSPRDRPAEFEREAAVCLEATLASLPPALRSGLAVEAGEVRSLLGGNAGDAEEVPLFSRGYRMASCRGVVFGIDEARVSFESPWTGTLEAEELDPALPVLLAPSAVLALVAYALEVTGSDLATESETEMRGLTVLDTAASPYPPQHHPFDEHGAVSPERLLLAEGCWRDRKEHAGDDVDPLFFLLTRSDRALRPLAAATRFNRRNLSVRCGRIVPAPSPAVLVDSWRVRVGPRSGPVPFHAELSRTGPDGERLAVTRPVALLLDPWQVLAQIRGASGPAAPGVDEDPIEGDSYGSAPTLATDLTFADLAAPEKPR